MAFTPFDLSGKVALVTGGNGGIGLGIAGALCSAGADAVIWGRDKDKLDRAAETLQAHGTRVHAEAVDVAVEADVTAAVRDAVARFGRLDAVFANAGVGGRTPFLDLDAAELHRILSVDLDGVVWTLREAARHMVARARAGDPGGSLVGVSSLSAVRGAPALQSYAAAKAAVSAVIRGLAVEFGRYGVRANTILPGWTRTDMTASSFDRPEVQEAILRRIPSRRWGSPDDFGGLAVYLCSDAAAYHTGQEFVVDGGYTIT